MKAEWSWAICISSPYISRGLNFTFNAEPKKPRTDDNETEMDEIWYTLYLQYEKICLGIDTIYIYFLVLDIQN